MRPLAGQPPGQAPEQHYLLIFGSDQGLIGQYNERLLNELRDTPAVEQRRHLLVIGERVNDLLDSYGLQAERCYPVPAGIDQITTLIGQLFHDQVAWQQQPERISLATLYHRHGDSGDSRPCLQTLLPLERAWHQHLQHEPWPTNQLPELCGEALLTLRTLMSEYLFCSLFGACAHALASENLSRLLIMQRAEKNIAEQLEQLQGYYHRERQSSIDAELFELIAGFELLRK